MNLNFFHLKTNQRKNNMKAIVKNTNEIVDVEKIPVYVDEMTSYFIYENKETHEKYKYTELKFN